jgi:CBS domain containing-hemolysin-like protein
MRLIGTVIDPIKPDPTADFVVIEGFRFEVMDMDGRRVDKVLVAPPK